ncbi:MAG TPA: hypothetical protein VHH36_03505 [Candidatus Thermoplasmatota archaeon]|nr:hypothetical protein [Candidatus Thermoplasmatota archaeon]
MPQIVRDPKRRSARHGAPTHDVALGDDAAAGARREARNRGPYLKDLAGFWRLLYTVVQAGAWRFVVIVEIVDRCAYDKWFLNKGR